MLYMLNVASHGLETTFTYACLRLETLHLHFRAFHKAEPSAKVLFLSLLQDH